jgi:SAM-dependent methyltransferase
MTILNAPLNTVELLDFELLENYASVRDLVESEKKARKKQFGWHYLLDLVWIVSHAQHLPQGSLILDAGAGNGLLQYVLLRLGFRVISVDFTVRRGPSDVDWLAVSRGDSFDTEYLRHLQSHHGAKTQPTEAELRIDSPDGFRHLLAEHPARLLFYRANLADLSLLPDGLVDAVVSVSALEHNDLTTTARAVDQCLRVLKPGGTMLATVSATDGEDWFHEPSKGWCYSETTLQRLFRLDAQTPSNFGDYARIFEAIARPGNILHEQLAPFYFASGNNGMPWGHWHPEYLPVGIKKCKGA